MSDEILVKVENVSKKFCYGLKRSLWYGVKDIAAEVMGRNNHQQKLRAKEFWALKDISFELKRGEVLGLIGRNGAGKTTILKILNGLIKPDSGRVTMCGKVGALIALGAGFNPVLTGRENIYINGSVLGLSRKKIDAKFDEIVDFAEVWDFIDTPVQSYSSGMRVRLGFAVASSLSPDILLIDEVLAVGDAAFRAKCYNRLANMKMNSSIILVSHSMHDIGRLCHSVLVFNLGILLFNGSIAEGISIYNKVNQTNSKYKINIEDGIKISNFNYDKQGNNLTLKQRQPFKLHINGTSDVNDNRINLIISIKNIENIIIAQCPLDFEINEGAFFWEIETEQIFLNAGNYTVDLQLRNKNTGQVYYWGENLINLHVLGGQIYSAPCLLYGKINFKKNSKNENNIPLFI